MWSLDVVIDVIVGLLITVIVTAIVLVGVGVELLLVAIVGHALDSEDPSLVTVATFVKSNHHRIII